MLSPSRLPLSPGVYIFKNSSGAIIYVGKAKNLRQRVRSYFQPPIKLGPKTSQLVSQITSLEHIEVSSEIEALLLESRLIKKFQPQYNLISKDDKSPYYIHITSEKFPRPVINHISQKAITGPFLNSYIARQILSSFRRVAPFCTAKNPSRPCLYSHLGLCHPCPGDPHTTVSGYKSNIVRLKKLLKGEFKQVMRQAVKILDFETAAALRNLLQKPISPEEYVANPNLTADRRQESLDSLQKVLEHCGLSVERLQRIEMYDVANLSGTSATAAMTVAVNGQIIPQLYRHFTIHSPGPNDVAMLKETLTRRLKTDWPRPDLIVLDGGLSQLSIISWNIPTIALAKHDEVIYTLSGQSLKLDRRHPGLQLLQRLRDEAHRFSRRLHHQHRRVIIK